MVWLGMFFSSTKGQLISNPNYLNILPKNELNICQITRAEVLGSFFGRIENK